MFITLPVIQRLLRFWFAPLYLELNFSQGTSSGSQNGTTSQNGRSGPPTWQSLAQQYMLGQGLNLYNQGPQQYYQGPQVASLSPQQNASIDGITNFVSSPNFQQYLANGSGTLNGLQSTTGGTIGAANAGNAAATDYLNGNTAGDALVGQYASGNATNRNLSNGSSGLSSFLGAPQNAYTSEAVQAAIQPMIADFQNNVIPGIRHTGIGNGSFDSTRADMAEGLAASGLSKNLANTASQIGYQSWQDQQNNKLNASNQLANLGQNQLGLGLNAAQSYMQNDLNRAQLGAGLGTNSLSQYLGNYGIPLSTATSAFDALGNAGSVLQNNQQQNINALMNQWNFNQQAPWQNLNNLATFANGNYGQQFFQNGTTSSSSQGNNMGGGISI